MVLIHVLNQMAQPETVRHPVHVPPSMFDPVMLVFFLKYNSISHYTLATTTGGKDLGLVIGIEIAQRPNAFFSLLSCWFGLLCFCFFFFTMLVRHTQFHLQSAMEAKGLRQY